MSKSNFTSPDICIIGSGAGASPVAYTLANAGYKVVILEKGGWFKTEDFYKDELACCKVDIYNPNLEDEQHVLEEKISKKWVATPTSESGYSYWNGCVVGGSSNFMSGFFHRMKPNDFKLKSTYANIEGGNVVDWPISYKDLEPYYDKIESLVGISGDAITHPFLEPRSKKQFPYPKTAEHPISAHIDKVGKHLGLHPIPTPRAILTQDKEHRKSCEYAGYCGSYGCATGAKGSGRAALLDSALQSGNLEIRPHSHVTKLIMNSKNKISEAYYIDVNGKAKTIQATLFVVAAQAIETARLLLLSKNSFAPNGIGNHSGELGKNLLFSSGGIGKGSFSFDKTDYELKSIGPFVNRSYKIFMNILTMVRNIKGVRLIFSLPILIHYQKPNNFYMKTIPLFGERSFNKRSKLDLPKSVF